MDGQAGVGKRAAGRDEGGPVTAGVRPPLGVVRGVASGVIGGLCCLAGAIAVEVGLGGAGFFGALMKNYQPYFMAASVALMGLWVARAVHRARTAGGGLRGLRGIARPVSVMGVTWAVTLVGAVAVARVAGLG
jgi:hypothetical protein